MFNLYRQTGAAGGKGMMGSLGKSNAHQYGSKDKKVTFADVAGQKETKLAMLLTSFQAKRWQFHHV